MAWKNFTLNNFRSGQIPNPAFATALPPYLNDWVMQLRRVSRMSLEIKKKKKKVIIRANFKLFHLYFVTFVVGNIIFSAIV